LSEQSYIAPIRLLGGFEAYVVMDRPGYRPGFEARILVLLRRLGSQRRVCINVRDSLGSAVFSREVLVEDPYTSIDIEYGVPEKPGVYEIFLELNGKQADSVKFAVESAERRDPLFLTIVWHNHQAPNYLPDGRVHGPWAYIYVWGDHLKPYGRGPYHYHAVMLRRHPSFKATYNLSPSLLAQWEKAVQEGVVFEDGRSVEPSSGEAMLVRETLNLYREALARSQIDVLTSMYAHTIAGFLTDVLEMDDVVREEVKYGVEVTTRVLGGGFTPRGFWTPEMAFSMKLVPILSENGIEYTVLDDAHHYTGARGEKRGAYKPYILVDKDTESKIVVLFRDHILSNTLSFKNNFSSEIHAWKCAYEYSYQVLSKWFDPSVEVLTIALDGENWMVFSKTPPLTAYFMDKLILYLEALADAKFLNLATLRDVVEEYPAHHVLYHIPTNSWLGSFRKWRGEVVEHESYWVKAATAYRKIKAYEELVGAHDEVSARARWALWHALDSDYWWAEFWNPRVIDAWLAEVDKVLDRVLAGVKITSVEIPGELVEGLESKITVRVRNELSKPVCITLEAAGPLKTTSTNSEQVVVEPHSETARELKVVPKAVGEATFTIYAHSAKYIISYYQLRAHIKPHIPRSE